MYTECCITTYFTAATIVLIQMVQSLANIFGELTHDQG
jgi:hypothetical protein